jgi:hypothetical protein
MPDTTTHATLPECEHFRPRRVLLVLPFAVAVATVAGIGWWAPIGLVYAVPLMGLMLALVALGNSGLIVSREGIEWYALHPNWRFRKIPWHAVVDVRKGLLGLGGWISLTVESGRYEPWAWGTPRPGRQLTIEIRPLALVRGDEVLDAIRNRLALAREVAAGERTG